MDVDRNDRSANNPGPARPAPAARAENFLVRWSRRKARAGEVEASTLERAASTVAAAPEPACPPKTDADMPPVETLNADSDFAQFLSPKVSERLRRAALRKLFHLPRFNVTDGLDDYAGDYRGFTPLGDIITADMRYQMERQAKAALARLQEDAGGVANGEKRSVPVATEASNGTAAEDPDLPVQPERPETGEDDAVATGTANVARTEPEKGKG